VAREHCDECGFDSEAFDDTALLAWLRALGPQWRALLAAAGDDLRTRPAPEVWSAIEYAAHSRDITSIHGVGVELALAGDEPELAGFPDDAVDAMATHYATEDADAVLDALEADANRLASLAADVPREYWQRGLTIGDSHMDVRDMLAHALHDSTHHLRDVELGIARIRAKTA
jgi:hypothetical protein